jgi:hypothetical protein
LIWIKNALRTWGATTTTIVDVRYGSKADIVECDRHVRFVPKADILRCSEEHPYSIASPACGCVQLQSPPLGLSSEGLNVSVAGL